MVRDRRSGQFIIRRLQLVVPALAHGLTIAPALLSRIAIALLRMKAGIRTSDIYTERRAFPAVLPKGELLHEEDRKDLKKTQSRAGNGQDFSGLA